MQLLAQTCEAIAATSKKTEKIAIVATYLQSRTVPEAALSTLFLSGRTFAAHEERTLQVGGSILWRVVGELSGASEAKMTAAYKRHGDLGDATLGVLRGVAPEESTLTLKEVDYMFQQIAAVSGPAAKSRLIVTLLARATAPEAKYLVKFITGELRIGLKESQVEEAIAKAYGRELAEVRRANMLVGDIGETLVLAAHDKLATARMRLFHPMGFMLATPAESANEAFAEFEHAIVEDKYDGIRAQAHISRDKVRIFSRTLDDITDSFPELIPALKAIEHEVILDGEILAWRCGQALAFSELQKRLGRKNVSAAMQREVPVSYVTFDLLYAKGQLVIDRPLQERAAMLDGIFSEGAPRLVNVDPHGQASLMFAEVTPEQRVLRAPQARADSPEELDRLFAAAQERGNEGLMIKDIHSAYAVGRRGKSWLKLKRELAMLDVVVTAVELGHGKRAGILSDYTFAVRGGEELLNIGKAYSGLTDKEIAEMDEWFRAHTLVDHGFVREVEPKIVIEVAFNAVMKSDRHASGFALRFPRILRIRDDKGGEEIDTLERAEEIYRSQFHQRTRRIHRGDTKAQSS
ncbi:DNA ligase I, ATP-dependent (dnl1) [Candidatus Koribacter versatilis Ellin345]|uniref:Probable DNA ligase n=1 Tax=Koribacter versatilis (strain Ellin345) TaxID=204669 RepID=DNLI_KORVE|nr:ATP-dependent DNA ligase [Candidatus Koribacter versatilis]Q1II25.1 RecName: Full=Probable DNA ligase; AltName: Full=Polydeoxyribonucleotide synthase [ATP] [Candidatus Koribacter versatilis Ellin345]ABF43475.1 DNA ligase I, ATP-dependent (dnl1) [Candidatus Koribacter versatilis Ellin345]